MNHKKKLLFINRSSLAGLTDLIKWCEYLRFDYEITYVGFKSSDSRQLMLSDIKYVLVPHIGPKWFRGLYFLISAVWTAFWFKGIIWLESFPKCEVIKKLLPWKKMIIDIRTLSVQADPLIRSRAYARTRRKCQMFDMVCVISEGVKQRLNITNRPVFILPLGADVISSKPKNFDYLRLLYVGTLTGRQLEKTIEGMKLFTVTNPDARIEYHIVGNGKYNERHQLEALSEKHGLQQLVHFYGRVPYNELSTYFENANIGVSFVPITEYYDDQPVTKTFEYAMSGLFVIGTATSENKKVITNDNGILIQDTSEDFCHALSHIYRNLSEMQNLPISESLKDYRWNRIVSEYMIPILDFWYSYNNR